LDAANLIKNKGKQIQGWIYEYGFLAVKEIQNGSIAGYGLFQTKYDFRNPSPLSLIEKSAHNLSSYANQHPDWCFRLNFPGIGYGGLDAGSVLPVLECLPDNVLIFVKRN